MNVGVLLSNFSPETGGRHTFEQEVFDSLLRLGDECQHTFHVFARHGVAASSLDNERVRVIPLTARRRFLEKLHSGIASLARFVTKRGRRELRYGQTAGWLQQVILKSDVELMWYPTPGAATMDVPYITTVWDLQHRLQPYFPEVSASTEWEKREQEYATVLRRATYVVTGTRVGKEEIERFYQVSPERIRTLPHPTPRFALDAPDGNEDATVLAKFDLTPGYLFYPAQFWPHKNHAALLRAVRLLKDKHGMTLPLVLVGADYGNQPFVKRLADELGIASQVHFLGFVSQRELVALYRNALATTYVTYFGPENLPPLEAFALGCPVVATRVAGADEQLGDAALLVDPRKPEEIARAVRSICHNDSLRQLLIEKGKTRARRFTGDDFVAGIVQILDEFQQIRSCWGRRSA